jgi:uncharacterized protein YbjT (DUF2867 family)
LPSALTQPIVSDDVAAALVDFTLGEPVNGIVDVAGPDQIRLDELVRQYLSANQDTRQVVTDANALYFGSVEVNDQSLVPIDSNARITSTRFEDWLSRSVDHV